MSFVHLHNHSQYSMLDSAIRLEQLVARVAEMGMPAVALTDHNNMFGAVQLVKECKDSGIKPILGAEVSVGAPAAPSHHLVLLAANQDGYRNLIRIVSRGWVDGVASGHPRVDLELIETHRTGLVGLSACMGGVLAQHVLLRGEDAGRQAVVRLRDCFDKGHFFLELQDHGFPEQRPLNEILVDYARTLDLPLVATNDCHYVHADDAHAELILQCIASGNTVAEMERTHHRSRELYIKSPAEMIERFRHVPQAIQNTLRLGEMCGGQATPFARPNLPKFDVPEGGTEEDYLRALSERGLARRFGELVALGEQFNESAYRERLRIELDVILKMGFAGYFLIVQDFINHAKELGIPVGPGRGSGAGSLVAWALRITDLNPIPYGLLFERFLNPERVSMPDFDVDFCMSRRDEVIAYVREKYGRESVGQIATFHLLKSRSVVRDVGRVMGMPHAEAGKIASLIPEPVQGKSVPIAQALEQEARLKALYNNEKQVQTLLDTAQRLEDLTRHAGMHAAGVVISEGPLWEHVPVFCPEPNVYVTQYHKDDVESAGLVKFDFLGLKTLTVIDITTRLINRRPDRQDEPFRIDRIRLDDAATYALLQSGETTNVFQLESSGMQSLFKQLRPDCFEDIVAAVALYRPGPLGSGMVEDFVQRKHGRVRVAYPHPDLEHILKETYGVIVYQEQVMQIARDMAGYSLGGADLLRRAMGKKKAEEMAQQKETFISGAIKKGTSKEDADRVFELMAFFAGYGFNKSHSAAYALLTYQTAYLKARYPVEFVCATLSADRDRIEKVVRTVAEARAMGVTVLPPDVNESDMDFTVVYGPVAGDGKRRTSNKPAAMRGQIRDPLEPKIRFGLGGIKGVGQAALDAIFDARASEEDKRPFRDMFDLAARVDPRRVNKHVFEALVQCGAMDAMHQPAAASRAQAFAAIDGALERGRKINAERMSGQTNLLEMLGEDSRSQSQAAMAANFPAVEPWDARELLAREKTTLGFYVSGHPLDRYAKELRRLCNATTEDLGRMPEGTSVTMGGSVENFRERTTKMGHRIAFFDLEDPMGRVEVIVRPRVLGTAGIREMLLAGDPVLVSGTVQTEQRQGGGENGESVEQAKVVMTEIAPLAESLRKKTRSVCVTLGVDRVERRQLVALKETLEKHPGPCPVTLQLSLSRNWSVRLPGTGLSVEPSESLLSSLERLFGEKVCELR